MRTNQEAISKSWNTFDDLLKRVDLLETQAREQNKQIEELKRQAIELKKRKILDYYRLHLAHQFKDAFEKHLALRMGEDGEVKRK